MNLGTGIIGGARFPEVVAQVTSHDNSVGGSMDVTLPGGIVAGELLLIVNAFRANSSIPGWNTGVSSALINVFWKIADGSEGASATISSSSGTSLGASVAYRIRGGTSVQVSTPATAASTNPNPSALSPSWGNKKTLWFAGMGAQQVGSGGAITVSAYPSGFSNPQTDIGISSFPVGQRVAVAEKAEKTATQDPGAFTISPSLTWYAATIGVRP